MRAVRYYGRRDVRVETVNEPTGFGSNQVLVRPLWTGICGTDLHEYVAGPIVTPATPHVFTAATLPQILGHEFSAEVVEVGQDVGHVKRGDRIVTSGHGGSFPVGIPVGEVVQTGDGASVRVRPYADFSRLEFVRVVDYGVTGLVGPASPTAPATPPGQRGR